MSDLTPRQTQILRLIQRFISDTGMPPTRAEIAHELGFRSANAAEEHLRALARKGVIALVPGTSRGIQRSEEHTSELQSQFHLVCRLLLEKKKKKRTIATHADMY